jgi:hypothetical protein
MNIVRRSLPALCVLLGGLLGAIAGGITGLMIAAAAVTPNGAAPHETALIGVVLLPWYLLGGVVGAVAGGLMGGIGGWVVGWLAARWRARRRSST